MADEVRSALAEGETARRDRRPEAAAAAFATAVEGARLAADPPLLVHALTRRAQIARDRKDLEAAIRDQHEALEICRATPVPDPLPHVLRHLADMLGEAGRAQEAEPLYAEMLALYRERPQTPALELANAWRSLAVQAQRTNDRARAAQLWSEVRDRYGALDDVFRAAGATGNPGVREADARLAELRGA